MHTFHVHTLVTNSVIMMDDSTMMDDEASISPLLLMTPPIKWVDFTDLNENMLMHELATEDSEDLDAFFASWEDPTASRDIDFMVDAVSSDPILISSGDSEVETRQRELQTERLLEKPTFVRQVAVQEGAPPDPVAVEDSGFCARPFEWGGESITDVGISVTSASDLVDATFPASPRIPRRPKLFCSRCKGEFKRQANLTRHYAKCNGEPKPRRRVGEHSCTFCDARLASKVNLSRHVASKHPDTVRVTTSPAGNPRAFACPGDRYRIPPACPDDVPPPFGIWTLPETVVEDTIYAGLNWGSEFTPEELSCL